MSNIFDDEDLNMEELVEEVSEDSFDNSHAYLKNEAVKRISKAKLFESLLSASFFEEDNVEESIKREVEKEVKTFVVSRLEELLGIKASNDQSLKMQAQHTNKNTMSLTPEETAALKLVAKKITSAVAPQQTYHPIKKITKKREVIKQEKPATAKLQQRTRSKSKSELELEKSSNISKTTGQNYAQVNNPDRIPQPSQDVMNQLMQTQAAKSFANFSGGQSQESQILAAAISLAQQKNRNVREE
jgi:hypothetical protein